ncbi:MarR family transcriptional regulator [Bacillus cereus]|uniref:MarR family transcriptional regulator n=1 Tax=Bacillus cereus TaxID=1396 RepID=UPI00345BB893
MTKTIIDFGQAEQKAKQRDLKIEKQQFTEEHNGVDQDEVDKALKVLSQATGGKEIYIGTKKSPQSKVRFVQLMQENLNFLYEDGYLTGREKIFLMDIVPYVAFDSNGIVHDIKAKNPVPANITEIASLIKSNRVNTSNVINSLVKKGLLAKGESGIEQNNAKAYTIFVNPHVLYAGDKDNVNEALKILFYRAMKLAVLKNLPNKLF